MSNYTKTGNMTVTEGVYQGKKYFRFALSVGIYWAIADAIQLSAESQLQTFVLYRGAEYKIFYQSNYPDSTPFTLYFGLAEHEIEVFTGTLDSNNGYSTFTMPELTLPDGLSNIALEKNITLIMKVLSDGETQEFTSTRPYEVINSTAKFVFEHYDPYHSSNGYQLGPQSADNSNNNFLSESSVYTTPVYSQWFDCQAGLNLQIDNIVKDDADAVYSCQIKLRELTLYDDYTLLTVSNNGGGAGTVRVKIKASGSSAALYYSKQGSIADTKITDIIGEETYTIIYNNANTELSIVSDNFALQTYELANSLSGQVYASITGKESNDNNTLIRSVRITKGFSYAELKELGV